MKEYKGYETLTFERQGSVVVVRINRPEVMNAVNGELHRELSTVFTDLSQDTDAKAIILTGAGRAFTAGADISWLQSMSSDDHDALFAEARRVITSILELPQPLIAALNGAAIGFGATLALFCDIVIASDRARIGDPHVVLGMVAGDGGAVVWPWLVGPSRAKEYLLTGEVLTAQRAEAVGLINRVVPDEDLLPVAMELATRLANSSVHAIQGTKASINKVLRETVNLVLDTSLALERVSMGTEAHRKACADFTIERPTASNLVDSPEPRRTS